MKQTKGNVSVLVMFIMIATSLMGLLAMHFVNQMMGYSSIVHNYYKTYYLTKAGLELGMTEANIRGLGFSTKINNTDFFKDNFLCGEKGRCKIDAEVKGKSSVIREKIGNEDEKCTEENAIHLKKGENLILPLFYESELISQKKNIETHDSAKKENTENNDSSDYEALKNLAINSPELEFLKNKTPKSINMGVLALNKIGKKIGEYNSNIVYFKKLSDANRDGIKKFLGNEQLTSNYPNALNKNFLYLMLGNSNEEDIWLCVKVPKGKKLPTQKFLMTSKAKYDDTTVSMQAKYKQALPDFFMNIGGYS